MSNGDFTQEELEAISKAKVDNDEKTKLDARKAANTEEIWNIIELKKMVEGRKNKK